MHKFLRAAGFSMYQKKKDIEKLLDLLETQPSVTKCVQIDEETNVCEMRTEIAPGIGLSIVGELNEEETLKGSFTFPMWNVPRKVPQQNVRSRDMWKRKRMPVWWTNPVWGSH